MTAAVWDILNHVSVGFSQGIRRSVSFIAMIMGPLWAGGMIHDLYVMLGVCLGLNFMAFVSETV